MLRDTLSNSTLGTGKVVKVKPYHPDSTLIRKAYQSSALHQKLSATLKQLKVIRGSLDPADEITQLK